MCSSTRVSKHVNGGGGHNEVAGIKPPRRIPDDDRENEGDLFIAASLCTAEKMAFIIRHTSGIVCAPLAPEEARRLHLDPMVALNDAPLGTAFTVSVDVCHGLTTGVSAKERTKFTRYDIFDVEVARNDARYLSSIVIREDEFVALELLVEIRACARRTQGSHRGLQSSADRPRRSDVGSRHCEGS